MEFRDNVFENSRVILDGNTYTGCTFKRCTIVFGGTAAVRMSVVGFDSCQFSFEGPAAYAVQFLTALYQSGSPDAQALVEQTFANIRSGQHPGSGGP